MAVSSNLKEIRKSLNLNQDDLAVAIGAHPLSAKKYYRQSQPECLINADHGILTTAFLLITFFFVHSSDILLLTAMIFTAESFLYNIKCKGS